MIQCTRPTPGQPTGHTTMPVNHRHSANRRWTGWVGCHHAANLLKPDENPGVGYVSAGRWRGAAELHRVSAGSWGLRARGHGVANRRWAGWVSCHHAASLLKPDENPGVGCVSAGRWRGAAELHRVSAGSWGLRARCHGVASRRWASWANRRHLRHRPGFNQPLAAEIHGCVRFGNHLPLTSSLRN